MLVESFLALQRQALSGAQALEALTNTEERAQQLAQLYGPPEARECLLPIARHVAALETMFGDAIQRASTDTLTGLRARAAGLRALELELARAARHGTPVAAVMLDLDHFKQVNDSHGHLVGDEVLRRVACAIQELLRTTDTAARYGGEELLLVAASEEPHVLVERILETVASLGFLGRGGERFSVTCSAGIAPYKDGDTPATILARADACLYAAKAAGRNTWRMQS